MTDKQECALKLAISTTDRHFDRYWNSAYTNLNTGVSVSNKYFIGYAFKCR